MKVMATVLESGYTTAELSSQAEAPDLTTWPLPKRRTSSECVVLVTQEAWTVQEGQDMLVIWQQSTARSDTGVTTIEIR